jgi:hypothetical protein
MLGVQEAIMKTIRILLVLILGLTTSFAALAGGKHGGGGYRGGGGHHHHHGGTRWTVGVNFGFPGYWGGYWGGWPWYGPAYSYYPYPYYPAYYPAPVAVPQQPTTYIEQPAPQAQQQQAPTGYWYYCADPGAYYPYIKECPAGWQRVAPQPAN